MADYAILLLPSLNRVYTGTAARLTLAELAVYNTTVLGGRLRDAAETTISGVPYVTFSAELDASDVAHLSNLASVYALYERLDGGLLRPLELVPLDLFSSDLLTILKYPGKTNEQFTKLLLNVTALSTDRPGDLLTRQARVLDPLCGRGTTLNQAMMYGLSVAGLDLDSKDIDAYGAFLKTWLRTNRFKHKAETAPVRRNRAVLGRRLDVELAPDKESYKAGELIKLTAIAADTLHIGQFFRNGTFDVVVADLPYGVQHGSHGRSLSRSPQELLRAALPGWLDLLAPGGALGLSWNTHVAGRDQVVELLGAAGLEALPYEGFEHRVDQAIIRDLVVARRA